MANLPMRRLGTPFKEFSRLQRQFDHLFEDLLGGLGFERGESHFMPVADFSETEKEYLVSLDVPGVSKDEVKIEIDDHQLIVSGERKKEREEKGEGLEFSERFYGTFRRVLPLPSDASTEKIEANYEDGVLEIRIPREATARKKLITIGEKKALTGKEEKKGKVA